MFMALSTLKNAEQSRAAADPETKQATWAVSLPGAAIVYIHHRHSFATSVHLCCLQASILRFNS